MSNNQDPARTIAERVARRLAADSTARVRGAPESHNGDDREDEKPRARVINFVSPSPPPPTRPSIGIQREPATQNFETPAASVPQVAQSPWLAPFSASFGAAGQNPQSAIRNLQLANHPSEERFGVEEAAVSELVEFFENEKKCSVDPSGKPCDHCAMCSSRGF